MARDLTVFAERVGQHLINCLEYHGTKMVIIPIDCDIRRHCIEKVEMDKSSSAYFYSSHGLQKLNNENMTSPNHTYTTLFLDDK